MGDDGQARRGWRPWGSGRAEDEIRALRAQGEIRALNERLGALEAQIHGLRAEVARLEARAPADRDYVERTVKALFERVEMLRRSGAVSGPDI